MAAYDPNTPAIAQNDDWLDVSPDLPVHDVVDILSAYTVPTGEYGRTPSATDPRLASPICCTDFPDLIFGQFCRSAPLTPSTNLWPCVHGVPISRGHATISCGMFHVSQMGRGRQVEFLDARAPMAGVGQFEAIRYRSIHPGPRKDVGTQAVAADVESPVASVVQITLEDQALAITNHLGVEPDNIVREADTAMGGVDPAARRTEWDGFLQWAPKNAAPKARDAKIRTHRDYSSVTTPGCATIAGDSCVNYTRFGG